MAFRVEIEIDRLMIIIIFLELFTIYDKYK